MLKPLLHILFPILLILLPGCHSAIEVQVIDVSTGLPLRDAEVTTIVEMFAVFPGDTEARTDAKGIARMEVNRNNLIRVCIRAEGYRNHQRPYPEWREFLDSLGPKGKPGASNRWIEYVERDDTLTYLISPVRTMKVLIIDRATRAPVAGARIDARRAKPYFTDEQGRASISVFSEDDRPLTITVPDMREIIRPFPEWWRFKRSLELPPNADGHPDNPPTWTVEMEPDPALTCPNVPE